MYHIKLEMSHAKPSLVLGRQPGRAQVLLNHPTVSRAHCRISWHQALGRWVLEDLESLNGTFKEGCRVDGMVSVGDGDLISLGHPERGVRVIISIPQEATVASLVW